MAHSVLAIGNWVIRHHIEKYGCGVTLMHLNKLLYLIDGWSMAILGSSIIKESPRCGRLCPYYEEIMNHLPFEGSHEINFNIVDWATEEPFSCPSEGKEFDLIDDVLSAYAGLSPMTLSAHLTRVGTPFHTTKNRRGVFSVIEKETMKDYYTRKLKFTY